MNKTPLRLIVALSFLGFHCCGWAAAGSLEIVSNPAPFIVLGGYPRAVVVSLRNPGSSSIEAKLTARLYQTSSSTAARLADVPWKRLQVLPGRAVLDSAMVDFPSVRAETPFLIQWIDDANRVLGETRILVYPTNLLEQLKPLLANGLLGIFDPANNLKPLLKSVRIEFLDLENHNFTNFTGRLAIVGPFSSRAQMREGLAHQVRNLAERGTAVLWIQPPPQPRDKLRPSFYTLVVGKGAVVVAQPDLVSDPADNPVSQLNLVYLSQLVVRLKENQLPFLAADYR